MEESLLDALDVTFKIKPEQRDAFAKTTLEYAEDAFTKVGEKIAQDIAALDEEGAGHKKAIEDALATLQEKEKAKESAEGELETQQNMWVDLENAAFQMAEASKRHDIGLEEAGKELELAKEDLKEFRDVNSLLAGLINPPAEPEPVVEQSVSDACATTPAAEEAPAAVEAEEAPAAVET